jgi:hypothetical protein
MKTHILLGLTLPFALLADAGASTLSLAQQRVNDAPCGSDTIAVVNTPSNNRYVFCASSEGTSVIEVLAAGNPRASLLERHRDPVDLLAAVLPRDVKVPDEVLLAVSAGSKADMRLYGATPFTVGKANYTRDDGAAKATCAAPGTGAFDMSEFINDDTFCGIVHGSGSSSHNTQWHQLTASAFGIAGEGSHTHAGPHEPFYNWYADVDEEGDARYGRAMVRSCGGTTQFRGWVKASPTTGSWDELAEYFVPSGDVYLMKWYSNPFKSLWMGYDADDIRFRADAQGSASFGSTFYFIKYAWGTNCDMVF